MYFQPAQHAAFRASFPLDFGGFVEEGERGEGDVDGADVPEVFPGFFEGWCGFAAVRGFLPEFILELDVFVGYYVFKRCWGYVSLCLGFPSFFILLLKARFSFILHPFFKGYCVSLTYSIGV